jgi:Ser/Thr protein kinase RdoA (MazF antagonist)
MFAKRTHHKRKGYTRLIYNLQFDKLCDKLKLGKLSGTPAPLTGGQLHRMYSVTTDRGRYAVKALNPEVMLRPPALPGIIESERVAAIAKKTLPAAPALVFDGSAVQLLDGQYYLIYDWIEGRVLLHDEIAPAHCARLGGILAALHRLDFGDLCPPSTAAALPAPDWEAYLRLGQKAGAPWAELLAAYMSNLYEWSSRLAAAESTLTGKTVVSHRDLEPKNVLWCAGVPVIIDWEAAGRIHPAHDMAETAVYWSKDGAGHIDSGKFKAFAGAYRNVAGQIDTDWHSVLNMGFSSLSGWLEYSLKRSLAIERCDVDDRCLGTEQVFETINAAIRYFDQAPMLLNWLAGD